MIILFLIVFGLILGSFVNALVWRLHQNRDWVKDRSECVHCHHKLAAKDLVPVLSWLYLRGKCRYCAKPIQDSPAVELLVPLLFVASYILWPQMFVGEGLLTFALWLIFIVGFTVLAVYDFKWFLLPDKVVFPLMALAVVQVLTVAIFYQQFWPTVLGAVYAVIVLSGLFFVLHALSKGTWIGFGDVKLAVVLGLLAGGPFEAVLLLFVASMSGLLVSLPMLVAGRANRKAHIPFGPFLLFATVVVVLFGAEIIDWYKRLLLLA